MIAPNNPRSRNDKVILLLLFAMFLLASPAVAWWAANERPWYVLYLLWGLLILAGALINRRRDSHDI